LSENVWENALFTSNHPFIVSSAWRQLKAIYQLDMANKGDEEEEVRVHAWPSGSGCYSLTD